MLKIEFAYRTQSGKDFITTLENKVVLILTPILFRMVK